MKLHKEARLFARFRFFLWLLIGVWSGCIVGSLIWNLRQQAAHSLQMARRTAQITFENDVLYRRWSAQQGGVYVRVSKDTPSNPYLRVPDRDVATTSGVPLTLVNPAYMARQVNSLAGDIGGSRGHLTSLKPIRPENAPDAWETAALRSFEEGVPEVSSVEEMSDGEHLRLMRPFLVEQSCLKCHADQGYKLGDIRGGVSMSVPLASLRAIENPMSARLALAHLGLWLVGLTGIAVFQRSLGKEMLARERSETEREIAQASLREAHAELESRVQQRTAELNQDITKRKQAEAALKESNERLEQRVAKRTAALAESEEQLRTTLESIGDGFFACDKDWRFVYVNARAEHTLGIRREEVLGKSPWDAFPFTRGTRLEQEYRRAAAGEVRDFEHFFEPWGRWFHNRCFPREGGGMSVYFEDITERKRVEEKLRETQAQNDFLAGLLRDSSQPLGVGYPDGRLGLVNRAFEELTGYTADELRLLDWATVLTPPEWQAMERDKLAALHQTRRPVRYEKAYLRKDGTRVPIELLVHLATDSEGKPRYYYSFLTDITERKRAEEALRSSEAKYRDLFENMTEEVHFWRLVRDDQGQIKTWRLIDANPPTLTTWGKALNDIQGRTTDEIFGPGAAEHYMPVVQKIVSEGVPYAFEDYFPNLDRYFRFTSVPLGDYFITTGADITSIKKAQVALRESEERFRVAQEMSPDGFTIFRPVRDDAGHVADFIWVYENAAIARLNGTDPTAVAGRRLLDVLPGHRGSPFLEAYQQVAETGKSCVLEASYHGDSITKVTWFRVAVVSMGNDIAVLAQDITERKQAEEQSKAALKEKEVLLKEIHHRVKNNMQVICSLVALQMEQLPDAAMRAVLQDVTHRVRSMALVHEKLYQSTDMARVEFAEYALSLLNYLWRAHGAAASGVRLVTHLEPVSLSVNAAVPCGLVLNELASNALKHGFPKKERGTESGGDGEKPGGCEVMVTLGADSSGRVCLRVRDNGTGLPPGLDWRQADSLGLRLVQMLAHQLDGTVEVQSGEGTEFTLTFEGSRP